MWRRIGWVYLEYHQLLWIGAICKTTRWTTELGMKFYKHIARTNNFSTAKEKIVDFSAKEVNCIYHLRNIDDQVTQNFLLAPYMNLFGCVLCPFRANWSYKSNVVKQNLFGINLCYKFRPLLAFVSNGFDQVLVPKYM